MAASRALKDADEDSLAGVDFGRPLELYVQLGVAIHWLKLHTSPKHITINQLQIKCQESSATTPFNVTDLLRI